MISFVIPAHNEEVCLPGTLDALLAAAREVGRPHEIIVVNDASTDRTAAIAAARGARVLDVQHRHIAATRNSGAREARGDFLFFVDADTRVCARAIRAGLAALEQGAVGGGFVFRYDGRLPWWGNVLVPAANAAGRVVKLVGGACVFCRRTDFEAIRGFDEQYFVAEDVAFVKAIKQRGRFVIPRVTVLTSSRKLRSMSLGYVLSMLFRIVVWGAEPFRSREGLGLWYGPEARAGVSSPS